MYILIYVSPYTQIVVSSCNVDCSFAVVSRQSILQLYEVKHSLALFCYVVLIHQVKFFNEVPRKVFSRYSSWQRIKEYTAKFEFSKKHEYLTPSLAENSTKNAQSGRKIFYPENLYPGDFEGADYESELEI